MEGLSGEFDGDVTYFIERYLPVLLVDLLLSGPLLLRLLVPQPSSISDAVRAEVLCIWRDYATNAQQADVDVLAVLVVYR